MYFYTFFVFFNIFLYFLYFLYFYIYIYDFICKLLPKQQMSTDDEEDASVPVVSDDDIKRAKQMFDKYKAM